MSFTAYVIQYVGPINEHWEISAYENIIDVRWDDATHKGVTLVRSNGGAHMNSPFPITVTRWAALIPMYLSKP